MYLCFFCIGAIYYVIILVIYSYSSTVLVFVKACILKSVFETSWCPLTVGAISFFFLLYCCTFLFPCIFILSLSFFFCNIHNLATKWCVHRRFTGSIPVAVCFITCIALGAAGLVFTVISFYKVRHCVDFSLAGYFHVSVFARCEVWKQQ